MFPARKLIKIDLSYTVCKADHLEGRKHWVSPVCYGLSSQLLSEDLEILVLRNNNYAEITD